MKLYLYIYILTLCLSLLLSANTVIEKVYSAAIKKEIAIAIEEAASSDWATYDNFGDVWVEDYKEGNESSNPYWTFSVLKKEDRSNDGKTDWMEVSVNFHCGSEYDESPFYGHCKVTTSKSTKKKWSVKVIDDTCYCGE